MSKILEKLKESPNLFNEDELKVTNTNRFSISASTDKLNARLSKDDKPYNSRKASTYSYELKEIDISSNKSLREAGKMINRHSVSGCSYKEGHRTTKKIISNLKILMLDVDEPNIFPIVDDTLLDADVAYIKVPSASNLDYDYKWHYILFLDKPLDTSSKTIYENQVIEILNNLSLNYESVDVRALKDLARHFSPACINPEFDPEDYDSLIECRTGKVISVPTVSDNTNSYASPKKKTNKQTTLLSSGGVFSLEIDKGGRNNHLATSVGVYFANGIQFSQVLDLALEWNSSIKKPLDESEVIATVKSIYDIEKQNNPEYVAEKYQFESKPSDDLENTLNGFADRWAAKLGNVQNDNLIDNWRQNFYAFDEVIYRNRNNLPAIKIISPSSTGTGKTQNIIHKAISLRPTDIGTLIVVLRTKQADEIAEQIQDKTNSDYVAVYHSAEPSKPVRKASTLEAATDVQCLVITHEMFKRAIDTNNERNALLNNRDLIVIDEEISAITADSLELLDIKNLLTIVKAGMRIKSVIKDIPPAKLEFIDVELAALTSLEKMLERVYKEKRSFKGFTPLAFKGITSDNEDLGTEDYIEYMSKIKLTSIIAILDNKHLSPSSILMNEKNTDMDTKRKRAYKEICNRFYKFFNQWTYVWHNGGAEKKEGSTATGVDISINTATEILPDISVFIMDATASVNSSYNLYDKYQNNIKVLDKIECRNYKNVNLYITKEINTGKEAILANKEDNKDTLLTEIAQRTEKGDNALIIVSQKFEPYIVAECKSFKDRTITLDHWGNLTGTCDYDKYNKIFIYGLNHKPATAIRNTHTLAKGTDKAFRNYQSEENKRELDELTRTDLSSEIIQAINRVRCRRVIDSDGNCDSVDVYLTLPIGKTFELDALAIEQFIKEEMPNINIYTWSLHSTPSYVKTTASSYNEAIIMLLKNELLEAGESISINEVKDRLDIDNKQFSQIMNINKQFPIMLEISKFTIEERTAMPDRRGRTPKKKPKYFVKI